MLSSGNTTQNQSFDRFPGEEVDHEAEEVLNELNLLTESEADSGGQGDDFPVGKSSSYYLFPSSPLLEFPSSGFWNFSFAFGAIVNDVLPSCIVLN